MHGCSNTTIHFKVACKTPICICIWTITQATINDFGTTKQSIFTNRFEMSSVRQQNCICGHQWRAWNFTRNGWALHGERDAWRWWRRQTRRIKMATNQSTERDEHFTYMPIITKLERAINNMDIVANECHLMYMRRKFQVVAPNQTKWFRHYDK